MAQTTRQPPTQTGETRREEQPPIRVLHPHPNEALFWYVIELVAEQYGDSEKGKKLAELIAAAKGSATSQGTHADETGAAKVEGEW
jgi:hypothetical protein